MSKTKANVIQYGIALAISFALAFAIEICAFNYQSLETLFLSSDNVSIGEQSSDTISLDFSESNIVIVPISGSVSTLALSTDSDDAIPLDISITDEGNQTCYSLGKIAVSSTKTIRVNPSGEVTSLQITATEEDQPNSDITVEVNKPIPFDIRGKRVLAMVAMFLIAFAVCASSPLSRNRYDASRLFPVAIGAISAFGLFVLCAKSAVPLDTPGYEHHHEYFELAQALVAGQTSLLAEPSPELLALDNPYDTTTRIASGAPYLWDHAYFNGHYYVYFGALPAIVYYLPFYLATAGGELPNWIAVGISYTLFTEALVFLLFNCCKKWFPKASQASFLLAFLTLLLGSWALHSAQSPDLYNVPISLGAACSTWGITFLVKAISSRRVNPLHACLGTALLSLTILCRPQMLIFGIVAIALATFSLREPETRKANAKAISVALIPVAIIAAIAGAYNYSRFGSPFDFGANYNLTTNDMTHRGWNVERLPLAFFAYLVEPFVFSLSKMAFLPVNLDYAYYGTTISQTMHGGILALVPILPCAVLLFLLKPQAIKRNEPLQLVVLLVLCALVIVAFDANGAGILMRYFADFGLLLSLAACLGMLALLDSGQGSAPPPPRTARTNADCFRRSSNDSEGPCFHRACFSFASVNRAWGFQDVANYPYRRRRRQFAEDGHFGMRRERTAVSTAEGSRTPWHKSRVVPQKYTLRARFRHKNRGVPRKQF